MSEIDGHSHAVNTGNIADISGAVESNGPLVSVNGSSSITMSAGCVLENNKNVPSGGNAISAAGGGVSISRDSSLLVGGARFVDTTS